MPEKWVNYARLLDGFMSLTDVVATGIGISRHTAWRWRHRMLKVQALIQSEKVSGIVEADATYFRSSSRGHRGWKQGASSENRPARYRGGKAVLPGLFGELVPVLTAVDRANGVVEAILPDRTSILPPRSKKASAFGSNRRKSNVTLKAT